MTDPNKGYGERQDLKLFEAAKLLLEECRMVLPGIQGLFGFQLIAVFNEGFSKKLAGYEQDLHLGAIALIGVAIALIMTPAATHRQLDPRVVTHDFIVLSTRLLLWSMAPLMLGLSLDFYLIARVITDSYAWAMCLSLVLVAIFGGLWWVLPRRMRKTSQ